MPFLPKWTNEPKSVLGIDLEESVALGMGMWMRYEAGNYAIVVSIKELSNDVLRMVFNFSYIFVKNHSRPKDVWCSQLSIMYLGLGMRYEAGICTIVISMKRTFN